MTTEVRNSPSGKRIAVAGAGIPDGSYVGQPVRWDGVEYEPLGLGFPLVLEALESATILSLASGTGCFLTAGSFIGLTAQGGAISIEATVSAVNVTAGDEMTFNASGGAAVMTMSVAGAALEANVIQLRAAGAQDFLTLSPGSAFMGTTGDLIFDSATLGFFAQTPVARPIITGATTQEQVDSLVSALVGLGLVIDDR